MIRCAILLVALFIAGCAGQQKKNVQAPPKPVPPKTVFTTCAEINSRIKQAYDFLPADLNQQERTKRMKQVEEFWAVIKDQDSKFATGCLATAMAEKKANGFFLYDGGKLLLSLSSDTRDVKTALEAMNRVDLRNVDLADYVQTMNALSCKGFDTSRAAEKFLKVRHSGAIVIGPQNLNLDKTLALYFILAPMEDRYYKSKMMNWLKDKNVSSSVIVPNGLYMFDRDVQTTIIDMNRSNPFPKELRKKVSFFSRPPAIDRSKKIKMTRVRFDEIIANSLRDGKLAASEEELNEMQVLVSDKDFSKLKELNRKIMCKINEKALYEHKVILGLLQTASFAAR